MSKFYYDNPLEKLLVLFVKFCLVLIHDTPVYRTIGLVVEYCMSKTYLQSFFSGSVPHRQIQGPAPPSIGKVGKSFSTPRFSSAPFPLKFCLSAVKNDERLPMETFFGPSPPAKSAWAVPGLLIFSFPCNPRYSVVFLIVDDAFDKSTGFRLSLVK